MRTSFLCLLTASLISGCGEFTYKQGAGLRELDNAKQACRSADEAATEKCLKEQGWFIHKFEDPNTSVDDEVNSEAASNFKQTETNAENTASDRELKSAAIETQATNITQASQLQKTDPNKIYKISSWWKIGASEKNMRMDLEQCGASLGVEHQPNIAEQRYTKALIQCMNKQGWKALGYDKGAKK
jgi:hypothetical protein